MNKSILLSLFIFLSVTAKKDELTLKEALAKNYPVVIAVYGLNEWDSERFMHEQERADTFKIALLASSIPTSIGIIAALIIWRMS